MPLEVGELQAKLSLDRSAFRSGLSSAHSEGSSAGSRMGSAMSSALRTTVVAGAAAVGAAAGLAIKGGFDFNSSIQQGRVAFTVLLGDAKKANKAVADLYTYAAKTPFQFPEILAAGRQLATVGLPIKDTIEWIGDLASVSPDAAGGITAVARAVARLQSGDFGESFERLRDFGISKKMLQGEGLVFDRGGQYTGSVEQAMSAVERIVKDKFGGMADAQSKTFSGQWSTIADNINQKLGEATKPAFEWVTNTGLPGINKALSGIKFDGITKDIGSGRFRDFTDAAKDMWKTVGPIASDIKDSFGPGFRQSISDSTETMTEEMKTMKVWAPAIGKVLKGIATVAQANMWTFTTATKHSLRLLRGDFGGAMLGLVSDAKTAWHSINNALGKPFSTAGIDSTFASITSAVRNSVNVCIGYLIKLVAKMNTIPGVHIPYPRLIGGPVNTSGWGGSKLGNGKTETVNKKHPHTGGDIAQTGWYRLLAGERVLSPGQAARAQEAPHSTEQPLVVSITGVPLTEALTRQYIKEALFVRAPSLQGAH